MSPIGGQSALHAVRRDTAISVSARDVRYFNTTSTEAFDTLETSLDVKGIYTTSILAPKKVKQSSVDFWGNVKIPSLRTFAGSSNATGWIIVPDDTNTQIEYSSLTGIPIMDLPKEKGTITFNLLSTYFDLVADTNLTTIPFILNGGGISVGYYDPNNSTFASGESSNATGMLAMLSPVGYTPVYFHIQQLYVESAIDCTIHTSAKHTCRVTAIRNTTSSSPLSYNLTQWPGTTMSNMITEFSKTTSANNSLSEAYLRAPDSPLTVDLTKDFNSSTLESVQLLGSRLAQLFNTYAFSTLDPPVILTGTSSQIVTTPAQVFSPDPLPKVSVSWVWLSIFAAAIFILALAAVSTLILDAMTLNPDILGYVSTATWRSPYIEVPEKGSFLDGEQRTKLLKDVVVRLGDVRSWSSMAGRLGIGTVDRTVEVTMQRKFR